LVLNVLPLVDVPRVRHSTQSKDIWIVIGVTVGAVLILVPAIILVSVLLFCLNRRRDVTVAKEPVALKWVNWLLDNGIKLYFSLGMS